MTRDPPLFVLTFDGADLCELAQRGRDEAEQNAALLLITLMFRKRERENAAAKKARE